MKKFEDKQLVVLLAGKATRLYPLTYGFPKCLLSAKQKPAIYNMILPLIREGLKDITLVVSKENKELIKEFIDNTFQNKDLIVNYVVQEEINGPGGAFKSVKNYINKPTILLLGDTLCSYPNDYENSWVGVSKVSKKDQDKYCMIESTNDYITNIYDKPQEAVQTQDAAVGIYYFRDNNILKEVLDSNITKKHGEYQLSSLLELYNLKDKMQIKKIIDWKDIGNLESYMEANKQSFNSRNFNFLFLDDLGVIHKRSLYEKITSEMDWYKEVINTDFEKFSPKFYDNNRFSTEYGIEYYDYLTLAEYMTFYPLPDYNKKVIFNSVIKKLNNIYQKNKTVSLEFNDLSKKILVDKTIKRLNDWDRQDIVNKEMVLINDKEYIGVLQCMNVLMPEIEKVYNKSIDYVTIIHGDPAFTNILFSPRSLNFKLIDARGNYGIDTIYGDYRYDLAKIRHCYHGRYDEITNDLFEVDEIREKSEIKGYNFKFYKNSDLEMFDEFLINDDVDIDDIELIEGLLFISMIPLHSDYPERQIAFYLQGLKILNHQIERRQVNV